MLRLSLLAFVVALGLGVAPAYAAPAPDLFTITAVKVDATAESATSARDSAMGQGRPVAWTRLFRRLVAQANWSKQPQLDENTLLRMVRSFEVAGERRSTTRYLADVTYHFNPAAVRGALRQAGVPYTEARARPALVIPVITGKGVDLMGAWAAAWKDPAMQQGLVPFVLPAGQPEDSEVLSRADVAQADWAALAPMARRYNAAEVILAVSSEDAKTVQMVEISATQRAASSFAFANSTFPADAEAVAEKVYETWKTRSAVNFAGARARLTADVQFDSLDDWAKIRKQLGSVRAVSDMDVLGLSLHEAEVELSYFGRPEQLRDALAQQDLSLINAQGQYTLQLSGKSALNAP